MGWVPDLPPAIVRVEALGQLVLAFGRTQYPTLVRGAQQFVPLLAGDEILAQAHRPPLILAHGVRGYSLRQLRLRYRAELMAMVLVMPHRPEH